MSDEKMQLVLSFNQDAKNRITKLQKITKENCPSDVIKEALAMYELIVEQTELGATIISSSDKGHKLIVIPYKKENR